MASYSAPSEAISNPDVELFLRESSGPNGERAPAALPLYNAVFAHDRRAAAKLLDQGSSPNALLYPNRWSVLMVAVAYQDKDMSRLLLQHGANINYVSEDPADYTALGVALNAALADGLRGRDVEPKTDFSMFDYLLDAVADLNVEFGDSTDIAILAATLGQMTIVNELLTRGYVRNLSGLKRTLETRAVSQDRQDDKNRAIGTIDRMLTRK